MPGTRARRVVSTACCRLSTGCHISVKRIVTKQPVGLLQQMQPLSRTEETCAGKTAGVFKEMNISIHI